MKRFLLAMFVGLVVCFGNSNVMAQYSCVCWYSTNIPDLCLAWSVFPGQEVPGTRKTQTNTKILSESGPYYNGQCPSEGAIAPKPKCKVIGESRNKYEISGSVTLANFGFSASASSEVTGTCEFEKELTDWCQCCHAFATIQYKVVTADFICKCTFGPTGILCTGTTPVSGSYTEYSHPQCGGPPAWIPACQPPCVKNCPG